LDNQTDFGNSLNAAKRVSDNNGFQVGHFVFYRRALDMYNSDYEDSEIMSGIMCFSGKCRNDGQQRLGLFGTITVRVDRHGNRFVQHKTVVAHFGYHPVDHNVFGKRSKTLNIHFYFD